MALGHFFKIPKHRRFSYTPRHYNPEQENLNARIDQIEQKLAQKDQPSIPGQGIKGQFKSSYLNQPHYQDNRFSIIRLLIILVSMILVFAILYFLAYLFIYMTQQYNG